MKEIIVNEDFKIINGNSLEVLDTLEENSIDAIICDPPYELGFMNKGWDKSGIAYNVDLWKKALRVLKPAGYLLAFGGSRTFHRIACAIEDAGFEIRDTIMWLYGSGFPKSMNVGKAIESLEKYGSSSSSKKKQIELSCDTEEYVVKQPNNGVMGEVQEWTRKTYVPSTEKAKEWSGFGTCLKPAYEPIIMARKPTDLTIAENVLKWRVGALNIDGCRVGNEIIKGGTMPDLDYIGKEQKKQGNGHIMSFGQIENAPRIEREDNIGRFPSNVILTYDETDKEEVCGGFPQTSGSRGKPFNSNDYEEHDTATNFTRGDYVPYNDDGDASRYFYCAKASKKDRDNGLDAFEERQTTDGHIRTNSESARKFGANSALRKNIHPTVKPIELMQYLIRLVCPKGATILDIFNGSGSTGKATAFENREHGGGYKYIGIELDALYCEISKARIEYALNKYEYELKKEFEKTGQLNLFDFTEGEEQ